MSNNQIQREWLDLSKIRKKLILLRHGTEMGIMRRHYSIAIAEIELALEVLRKVIEGE
jgi:hypothetical protein|tara:strand:- start:359 stop:532 length:174 start_codon:yes stop_codon:yes gene_type:complete